MIKGRKAAEKKKATHEHQSLHRRTMADPKVAEMVAVLGGGWPEMAGTPPSLLLRQAGGHVIEIVTPTND